MSTFERREITTREQAQDHAIEWQHWMSDQSPSMGELVEWQLYFEELARRFDLGDEFSENGII